jgi:hypothetical protein
VSLTIGYFLFFYSFRSIGAAAGAPCYLYRARFYRKALTSDNLSRKYIEHKIIVHDINNSCKERNHEFLSDIRRCNRFGPLGKRGSGRSGTGANDTGLSRQSRRFDTDL